jgi:hypothetical protein
MARTGQAEQVKPHPVLRHVLRHFRMAKGRLKRLDEFAEDPLRLAALE